MLFLVGRRDGIVFAAYIGGGLLFGFEIPFPSLVFLFSLVDPSPFFVYVRSGPIGFAASNCKTNQTAVESSHL